jgi:hypothetical protein
MSGIDWARLPLLALMLVLLVSGSVVLLRDQQSAAALVLLTAGMVTLGSWLTVETVTWYKRVHTEPAEAEPAASQSDVEQQ